MKIDQVLEHLERAAASLAVAVTYEPLQSATGFGGLCRVRGEYRVIIDKRATTSERVTTLAKALSRMGTETLALPAEVRDVIGSVGGRVSRHAS